MLMVGAAAVQRGGQVKADLPVWLGILSSLEVGSRLEGFMIRVPASNNAETLPQPVWKVTVIVPKFGRHVWLGMLLG